MVILVMVHNPGNTPQSFYKAPTGLVISVVQNIMFLKTSPKFLLFNVMQLFKLFFFKSKVTGGYFTGG